MDEAPRDRLEPADPQEIESSGLPRWVKISLVIAVALVLVAIAVMALSGSEHGPGRHLGGVGREDFTPVEVVGCRPLGLAQAL
ncbi:hypothetical protein ACQPX6_08430 [Actinomycetospora sp. CA-101289]|uniref:hypothetical protein n=1 Tax=Actinomycetospora sp. CA-101289 TaxID=3239893 RepID=UPI003D970258